MDADGSFTACVDKVNEAYHFLLLMRVAELPEEDGQVPARLQGEAAFRFAFSAFLSATRTALYYLQEDGASTPGFTRWYVSARDRVLKDPVGAFFHERRQFRIVFPTGVKTLTIAPAALSHNRIDPMIGGRPPDVHAEIYVSKVSFFERPGYPASELCARYLESLASLTEQAIKLSA